MNICKVCSTKITRKSNIYCSNKCQKRFEYIQFIEFWKDESEKGNNVITSTNISHYIRRYLIEKYSESCSICGWSKRNPITNVVPLEVDHIDGTSSNNLENNLRILCPNCHALTENFRNLNKGSGRVGRSR